MALTACDGRRTVPEIAAELVRLVKAGSLETVDFAPGFEANLESAVAKRLERTLSDAVRHLLLIETPATQ